jgi:hypothetical protein
MVKSDFKLREQTGTWLCSSATPRLTSMLLERWSCATGVRVVGQRALSE